MGSESLFRLVSLLVFGAVITACAALQQPQQSPQPTNEVSATANLPVELDVESLTDIHQINSDQFRPYEMGSFKNFGDSGQGFDSDPNL